DINFHIDAENDEIHPQTSEQLPARAEIREALQQHIDNLPSNNRLRLHYLRNRVHMELFMEIPESEALPDAHRISEELARYAWFGSLRIWHAHTEN
ncbi:MAG: cation transporter, partial [Marinobacter sp.]